MIILVAAVWVIVEAVGAMVRASRGEVDDDEHDPLDAGEGATARDAVSR